MTTHDLLEAYLEKRQRLDTLKAQSPEVAEAIALAEDCRDLYRDLLDTCKPAAPVPYPVPVYPAPPAPQLPYWINVTWNGNS